MNMNTGGKKEMNSKGKLLALIFYIIVIIIFFAIISAWMYFPDEILQGCQYIQRVCSELPTQIRRYIINNQLNKQIPLFGPYYKKIYPPHTHFRINGLKEEICFENCYQRLYHMRSSIPKCLKKKIEKTNKIKTHPHVPYNPHLFISQNNPIELHDTLFLSYILRNRYYLEDVLDIGIEHVQISLIQQILLWQEKEIKKKRETKIRNTNYS